MEYIWQSENWPHFTYNLETILESLSESRKEQGAILRLGSLLEIRTEGELLLQEALNTSEIEGEHLNIDEVRSSIAYRLGLPRGGLPANHERHEGLVAMLVDATTNFDEPLNKERLFAWHSELKKITVGAFRSGNTSMDIVSGSIGKERVHYTAPPSDSIEKEMDRFIEWWESSKRSMDGLIRAAYAHFYFVSIHPFEDGNGRIARALTDLALAQDEKSGRRLYSLSSQILKDREEYYKILEEVQKGAGEISSWLLWFFKTFLRSLKSSIEMIEEILMRQTFQQHITGIEMNARQRKVVDKMIEKLPDDFIGGMTNKKYVRMTDTSPATAKRDLQDLVDKKVLIPSGAGRSVSYQINKKILK